MRREGCVVLQKRGHHRKEAERNGIKKSIALNHLDYWESLNIAPTDSQFEQQNMIYCFFNLTVSKLHYHFDLSSLSL